MVRMHMVSLLKRKGLVYCLRTPCLPYRLIEHPLQKAGGGSRPDCRGTPASVLSLATQGRPVQASQAAGAARRGSRPASEQSERNGLTPSMAGPQQITTMHGACVFRTRRDVLFFATAVVLGLAGATWALLAREGRSYSSPSGQYTLRYPTAWDHAAANGVVSFFDASATAAYRPNATVVAARMGADWSKSFEADLEREIGRVGTGFAVLGREQSQRDGLQISSYTYGFTAQGNTIVNTVHVFDSGRDEAMVLTCSSLAERPAAVAAAFDLLFSSFQWRNQGQ